MNTLSLSNRVGLRLLAVSGMLGTLILGPVATPAATIIVNSTNDPGGYNSNITVATLGATVTLRDAVNAANNTPGDDTITFAPALGGAVVPLSLTGLNLPFAYGPVTNDGLTALYITSNIAFTPPPGGVTIKKDSAVTGYLRLFDIGPGAVVSLTGMTVSGGSANNGANFWNQGVLTLDSVTVQYGLATTFTTYGGTGFGGGIFNQGSLNVLNSTFYADDCLSAGGAIFNANSSSLSASNTLFNQCHASFGGGAVLNEAGALAQFVGCKFTGDSLNADYYWFTTDPYNGGGAVMNVGAAGFSGCSFSSCSTVNTLNGGAILNAGTGSVNACTFSGNSVSTGLGNGGAIENSGTLVVTNGTFTANSARYGPAIDHSAGSLALDHCTIMRNQMVANGYSYAVQLGSTCSIRSSILSENTVIDPATTNVVSRDVTGSYSPATFNIVGSTNVGVGALSDNGGPVPTMPLQVGSPAVNGVQWFSDTVPADARGVARCGTWPDIGAYELLITTPAITSSPSTAFIIGQTNSFQIAASSAPPASFSYIGSLPSGVTLTSSGLLSGVPASGTKGSYTITVIATNYYQYSGVQSFTLTVCDGTLTDPYSWSLNGDNVNGGLSLANNTFTFTDGTGGENRSAWFRFQQYVAAFEVTFIYQDIGGGGADGVAFVMQSDPAGISAVGGGGGGLGYIGISPSVGMMLNIYSGAPGGPGIFLSSNGAGLTGTYQNASPVNLASGDPIKVDLLYLGSSMLVTLTDLASNKTYMTNFTVNIPGTLGGNKAWIGLTGSEGGVLSHQTVSNFTYTVLDAGPVIVVNSTNDPGGFNPNLIIPTLGTNVTLRDAISAANNTPGTVNIRFAPGLSGTTIPLYQVGDSSYGSSAFGISGHVVIDNTNASIITLTRATSGDLRFFNVLAGGNLTLRNLRLTGGRFPYSGYNGPSLYNSGTLLVDHSRVDGGYTPTYGGGLYSTGSATINASTIDSCFANFAGGGIYNAGTLAISASTISANTTAYNNGITAGGGAVFNSGTLTLTNCTIANNVSSGFYCGGIWNYSGSLSLYSCTIAGNTDSGWGSPAGLGGWQVSILCKNCIIADSASVGLPAGSANNLFFNPGLGTFGFYGGPTAVFPLLANSAAIAAGVFDPASTNDQRGVVRHNPPDIGAFEFNSYVESILVTTTNDEFNGTSDVRFGTGTSLREAIVMNPDTSVIKFDPSLAGKTIVLTNVADTSAGPSALVIDKDLSIVGTVPGITIACAGSTPMRMFLVKTNGTLDLEQINAAAGSADRGGLVLNNGWFYSSNSTFTGFTATNSGGALYNAASGHSSLANTTFASNTAGSAGGAIANEGIMDLRHCTISGNNAAVQGGGIFNLSGQSTLTNTIVARNTANASQSDIAGNVNLDSSSGNNLIGIGGSGGLINGVNSNLVGVVNPGLGPLTQNGGLVPTMALLIGSPAINAARDIGWTFDARGYSRTIPYDIGAFELRSTTNSASHLNVIRNLASPGTFGFNFTNGIGYSFSAYGTTNLLTPPAQWNYIGPAAEIPPGSGYYQFSESVGTNWSQKFFRIQSP